MRRKLSLILTFSLIAVIFISFEVNCAVAAINNLDPVQKLPYFLRRFAEYKSRGNATALAGILNQMVQQETRKQEMIKSTNGAVLRPPIPLSSATSSTQNPQIDYVGFYWMSSIQGYSPPMYDQIFGYVVGRILDPTNLEGYPDNSYADLLTCGWDQIDPEYGGGEALAHGYLTGTAQSGQVYIQARVGSYWDPSVDLYDIYGWYMWENYVIVCASDGLVGFMEAPYVGYVSVQSTSKTQYYVGPMGYAGPFNWLYIFCWTPPWYPYNYWPHSYNSVEIDTAFVWGSNP